ncbi:MAG: TIGR03905 family TSCPD domain-containing protein [Muribaculaceae bacterium]|nr:TIGR03905 family TSCPD domain-containing protein [Muribaculaceae bacterium]MDE6541460.1 TIGR03905 family TSCPD domain-containing protein [Muribaculaceae bacterium]
MHHAYTTRGTCSRLIEFDIDDTGIVRNVRFTGGCHGNLQGIAALVEGQPAAEVAARLRGIRCGSKPTSCPDQFATAIELAQSENS